MLAELESNHLMTPTPKEKAAPLSSPGTSAVVRIERFYTHAILSGGLAPGTKLPPSNEIAKEWAASGTAVQQAMRRLSAAGLVDRGRKSGTIVRNQAERAFVGLVIGPSLSGESAHFFRAFALAVEAMLKRRGLSCRIYDGVHPMSLPAPRDCSSLDLLEMDRLSYQFKGFILVSTGPSELVEITRSGLPTAAWEWHQKRSDIRYDKDSMAKDVLREISQRGHRRVLVISASREGPKPTAIQKAFQLPENNPDGLPVEHLIIEVSQHGQPFEKAVFDRMLEVIPEWKKVPSAMPEVLVILDDIVPRAVCLALFKHQISVPEELEIVIQATESIEHHYGMPVHRFERSYLEVADHLTSLLWKRIVGEELPPLPIDIRGKFKAMNP